jgi:hypothetical protein
MLFTCFPFSEKKYSNPLAYFAPQGHPVGSLTYDCSSAEKVYNADYEIKLGPIGTSVEIRSQMYAEDRTWEGEESGIPFHSPQKARICWALVAHSYNLSYLGGRSWFEASPGKKFMRPPSSKIIRAKWTRGGVAREVEGCLLCKSQSHQKQKEKKMSQDLGLVMWLECQDLEKEVE